MNIEEYAVLYKSTLLENVLPFWENHSLDLKHGGYFTCLDREGKVYDTDKFIWLQCRQVWLFSMLYNNMEAKQEWLEIAEHGAHFLMNNGMDKEGNWYFSLTKEGEPLVQPYNIFSDCFAAMAFAQLGKASGNEAYSNLAKKTFLNILGRKENPKGKYDKSFPGTRPAKGFALPMILSNLVMELEHVLDASLVNETIAFATKEVMDVFYRKEHGLIVETVATNGSFMDTFDGRLVNPGHGLEAMWFMMDIGRRNGDDKLIEKTIDISFNILDFGWDQKYGGIFYFKDLLGNPPDRLDWDQKLWWVHQEAILAMLKGYANTGNKKCWEWFRKLHDYTWEHFADKEYGEWYGYLNRQGEVLLPLKGGKWKGCFHTPRFLYQGWKTLNQIDKNNK
ncbi:AGE family epimerase/isomerase [Aestuariivivens sp. NBU2969]|uniref:AGE family epimerase/isomerase n=1 Tax=Aestuariivivens sp. NBU2969 TaxID=2873267 RepID=UPI001CBBB644|nr:AGE family epimerase/isomerase [Aestuariivivens sp. NBU2969]